MHRVPGRHSFRVGLVPFPPYNPDDECWGFVPLPRDDYDPKPDQNYFAKRRQRRWLRRNWVKLYHQGFRNYRPPRPDTMPTARRRTVGMRKRRRKPVGKVTKKQIKAVIEGTKETKHNQFADQVDEPTNLIPINWSVDTLTGLAQGTAATQRVGISIAPKTFQVNAVLRSNTTPIAGPEIETYRFYCYQDVDAAAVGMDNIRPGDLWPTQSTAQNRYKLLFNRVIVRDSTKPARYIRIVIPASKLATKRIQFASGAGAQLTTSGNIHFNVTTDNALNAPRPVTLDYNTQLTYHDA